MLSNGQVVVLSTGKNVMAGEKASAMFEKAREVLRARLGEMRISAREASRRAGLNVGYAGDFLSDRYQTYEADKVVKLAEAVDIPASELFESAHDPLVSPAIARAVAHAAFEGSVPPVDFVELYAPWAVDEAPAAEVRAVRDIRWPAELGPTKNGYALTVFNSLNAPRYLPGEIVFVSGTAMVRIGDFVAFRLEGEGHHGIGRVESFGTNGAVTVEFIGAPTGKRSREYARGEMAEFQRIVGSITI